MNRLFFVGLIALILGIVIGYNLHPECKAPANPKSDYGIYYSRGSVDSSLETTIAKNHIKAKGSIKKVESDSSGGLPFRSDSNANYIATIKKTLVSPDSLARLDLIIDYATADSSWEFNYTFTTKKLIIRQTDTAKTPYPVKEEVQDYKTLGIVGSIFFVIGMFVGK